jgi:hypothetical protein
MRPIPTAPIAAGSLIAGYATAVSSSGSRPLGGAVLLAGGAVCVRLWTRRNGVPTAVRLASFAAAAFIGSHLLAAAVGAWPAVLIVSAATAAAAWRMSDSRSAAAAPSEPAV